MDQICQEILPYAPWMHRASQRLPGVQPLDMRDWLVRDEVFSAQMALRDQLMFERREEVFRQLPEAGDAAQEVLELVLRHLDLGYVRSGQEVRRPDGVFIDLDGPDPLITAARLVQEDLCILQRDRASGEYILTGAVLCFPASWTLAEKIGHPMTRIHAPVGEYTPDMARRVARLFEALRAGRPLWRANALLYDDPSLFQPCREAQPRYHPTSRPGFLRSERQSLLRLPKSQAVLFSIHSWVVPWGKLTEAQRLGLDSHPVEAAGQGL